MYKQRGKNKAQHSRILRNVLRWHYRKKFGESLQSNMLEAGRLIFDDATLSKPQLYIKLEALRLADVEAELVYIKWPKKVRPLYVGDQFYSTDEWLRLRYRVLVLYGRACMACGKENKAHIDHILPRSAYPKLELEFNNLQVLCHDCNIGKSNTDTTDWRPSWAKQKYPLPDVERRPLRLVKA